MKTMSKVITLPSGATVRMTAQFEYNLQYVKPTLDGNVEELLAVLGEKSIRPIDGIGFDGWRGRILAGRGCRVENNVSGEWESVEL